MHSGVKILLERIKTNPEEFLDSAKYNKWSAIIDRYKDYFTDEEDKALKNALREVIMSQFDKDVLKTLMNEKQEEPFDPFGKTTIRAEGSSITYSSAKYK
jgi:hypothetical protein